MARKIKILKNDGGRKMKTKNLNNSLMSMEPEIGNALQASLTKELMYNVSIDGKRFSIQNLSKAHG